MKITFDVIQEDINKAIDDLDCHKCIGAVCFNRVLGIENARVYCLSAVIGNKEIYLNRKFSKYLYDFECHRKVNPEAHSINIPKSVLEKIGYFDRNGTTTIDDYIRTTAKENNIEESKQQRRTQIIKEQTNQEEILSG